jgi:hypothetical protein
LASTERLLTLHAEAIRKGLAPEGERGELEFVALAEHARAYATSNAPGMFAWLVRNYERTAKRFVTQDDEESARQRLNERRRVATSVDQDQPRDREAPSREPAAVGTLLAKLLGRIQSGAMESSEKRP